MISVEDLRHPGHHEYKTNPFYLQPQVNHDNLKSEHKYTEHRTLQPLSSLVSVTLTGETTTHRITSVPFDAEFKGLDRERGSNSQPL